MSKCRFVCTIIDGLLNFNYYLFITLFLNTVIAIQKIHHYIAAKYTKYAA